MGDELCARTGATAVDRVGKILILWRPRPLDDEPGPRPRRAARARALRATASRASRSRQAASRPASSRGGGDDVGLADHDRHRRARLRHLRAVPAPRGPGRRRLDVERHDRDAGDLRQEHRARLGDARRPARSVEREPGGVPLRHRPAQLDERARAAARRRPAGGAVAEAVDHAGDPFAVEVGAGDDDDAAVAEEERRRQDAPVPERHDRRRVAGPQHRVQRLEAFDAPAVGRAQRGGDRRDETRDQARPGGACSATRASRRPAPRARSRRRLAGRVPGCDRGRRHGGAPRRRGRRAGDRRRRTSGRSSPSSCRRRRSRPTCRRWPGRPSA